MKVNFKNITPNELNQLEKSGYAVHLDFDTQTVHYAKQGVMFGWKSHGFASGGVGALPMPHRP